MGYVVCRYLFHRFTDRCDSLLFCCRDAFRDRCIFYNAICGNRSFGNISIAAPIADNVKDDADAEGHFRERASLRSRDFAKE